MKDETDELSPQERKAFAELDRKKLPPPFLEDRVVEKLRSGGLIRGRSLEFSGYLKALLAAGFSIIIFSLGALVGASWLSSAPKNPESAGFMLIVRVSAPELEAKSAAEELQRVKEYSGWARDLRQRGLLIGGEKLKDESRLLSTANDRNSISETSGNAGEGAIAGYFLLPASGYDQAVAIARTCPHLKHGGTVELRQIERF